MPSVVVCSSFLGVPDGWNETVAAGTGWPSSVNTTPLKCRVTSRQLAKVPVKHPDREAGADGANGCARLQADATTTTKSINRGFIGFLLIAE